MRVALLSFLIFIHFAAAPSLSTAKDLAVVTDLQPEWKVFQNDQFVKFDEREKGVATVYFLVDGNKFPETYLEIRSPEYFALFINGQLVGNKFTELQMSVDSLVNVFKSTTLNVGIHQGKIIDGGLTTVVQSNLGIAAVLEDLPTERTSFFRDFAITGMLILVVMLIIIIQLNPKLAADYLSFSRIFSMREGDDTQAYSRIASSTNILFYAHCSLMLGYYLMIVFHFLPSYYAAAVSFQAHTFWDAIYLWLQLSVIMMGLFFLKIVLVYSLSFIFGISEIGGIHFFNWVRLLLGVFGVLTLVLFLYFAAHGNNESFYVFLLSAMSWILAGWTLLIILKLHRQLGHSMFHLFSYICATELIPFLVTIKVLYY